MNRKAIVIPGYNCIDKPCGKNGCGERPGASHGQHCDEWLFVVSDEVGDVALALTVGAGNFPRGPRQDPEGYDLSLHVAWPTDRLQIRDSTQPNKNCTLVTGGCFVPYSTALGADEFVAHLVASANTDQSDSFWLPLEDRFAQLAKEYRAQRVDLDWQRCPHCDATGTVRR